MIRRILASLCISVLSVLFIVGATPSTAQAAATQGYNYSCGVDNPNSTQCRRQLYREMRSCQQKIVQGTLVYSCEPVKKALLVSNDVEIMLSTFGSENSNTDVTPAS